MEIFRVTIIGRDQKDQIFKFNKRIIKLLFKFCTLYVILHKITFKIFRKHGGGNICKFNKISVTCMTDYEYELLVWPAHAGWLRKTAWVTTWPIHLVFMCTIPDCEKPRFKNWFPITFIMCIIWIGSLSYVVAWMITIIGEWRHNFICSLAINKSNKSNMGNSFFRNNIRCNFC